MFYQLQIQNKMNKISQKMPETHGFQIGRGRGKGRVKKKKSASQELLYAQTQI